MIRREDFIDALGMPDEGFTNAVDAALRQVKEGEARPVMKRKMTLTMLAAALAVIALTGAAPGRLKGADRQRLLRRPEPDRGLHP